MKKSLRRNRRIITTIAGAGLLIAVVAVLPAVVGPVLNPDNQLAQIIHVETKLLRQWQLSQGLKNTIGYNAVGSDVALLQRMLSQDPGIYPEQQVTGYYGMLTREAVVRFQSEYHLPQTGVVGPATKSKLNEVFLHHLCPEPTTIYSDYLHKKVARRPVLPADYVPPQLEEISAKVKTVGIMCLRKDVVPSLVALFSDAKQNGIHLLVTSAYRKPEIQKDLYDFWVQEEGDRAFDEIAEPGASEHQLGTTVDLTDASIGYAGVDQRFGESVGGKWLMENAHNYGFTMSYPEGKEGVTGYAYEPWHWRYVGVKIATKLREEGLTLNESSYGKK